jgi:hypothetical protein
MENHLEEFYFGALLPELDPRHKRGQPIRRILKKEL